MMPRAQTNPTINARRFAALLAGFDTGNGSEEEAIAKGRALRRMAAEAGMRVVDAMELPDVKQAIDDQMRPARTESPALRDALEQAAALGEELTERTRDVRKFADLLRQQEEKTEKVNRELDAAREKANWDGSMFVPSSPALGVLSWVFELVPVLLSIGLMLAATLGGYFFGGRR